MIWMSPGSVNSPLPQLSVRKGLTPAATSFTRLGPADVLQSLAEWIWSVLGHMCLSMLEGEAFYLYYYEGGGILC